MYDQEWCVPYGSAPHQSTEIQSSDMERVGITESDYVHWPTKLTYKTA